MDIKKCILNSNKICDNCGECDKCDLDSSKICDNCGRCMEMENSDARAVKIDEIIDDLDDFKDYDDEITNPDSEEELTGDISDDTSNEVWEYIDDIDGLRDILEDEDKYSKYIEEEFPGFIKLKKLN